MCTRCLQNVLSKFPNAQNYSVTVQQPPKNTLYIIETWVKLIIFQRPSFFWNDNVTWKVSLTNVPSGRMGPSSAFVMKFTWKSFFVPDSLKLPIASTPPKINMSPENGPGKEEI